MRQTIDQAAQAQGIHPKICTRKVLGRLAGISQATALSRTNSFDLNRR